MANDFNEFDNVPKPQLVFDMPETPAAPAVNTEQAPAPAPATVTIPIPPAAAPQVPAQPEPAEVQERVAEATSEQRAQAAAAAAAMQAPVNAAAAAATVALDFGTAPAAPQAQDPEAAKRAEVLGAVDDSALSAEEKAQVERFSHQIDLSNSAAVLQYGAGAQKKMADFSQKTLENVKTKDLGEVGDMISGLVTELRSFDADEGQKGFLGLFKKQTDKMSTMKAKYDKAEVNVDKICHVLEDHQVQLLKDIAMLDNMYALNLSYFKELTMYILAGKKRLQEVREGELAELTAKATASGLAEDAQAARDLDEKCERFEKKLYDLELTRAVALQTAPQIRLVQDSDQIMVEKIQSTLVNTIPLWKNQMVIALGVQHSTEAAKAQREVTNLTNEL